MELELNIFSIESNQSTVKFAMLFCSDWTIGENSQSTSTSTFKFDKTEFNRTIFEDMPTEAFVYINAKLLTGSPLEETGFIQKMKSYQETDDQYIITTKSMTYLLDNTIYIKSKPEYSDTKVAPAKFLQSVLTQDAYSEKYNSPIWLGKFIGVTILSDATTISRDEFPCEIKSSYTIREVIDKVISQSNNDDFTLQVIPSISDDSIVIDTNVVSGTYKGYYKEDRLLIIDLEKDDSITGKSITISESSSVNKVILRPSSDNAYYTESYTYDYSDGNPIVLAEATYSDSDVGEYDASITEDEIHSILEPIAKKLMIEEEQDNSLELTFQKSFIDFSRFKLYAKVRFIWGNKQIDSRFTGFTASNNFDSLKMTFGYQNVSLTQKMRNEFNFIKSQARCRIKIIS